MRPQVSIVMGSESDLEAVRTSKMVDIFNELGIVYDVAVISAHRNPLELTQHCSKMVEGGVKVFIGIAGLFPALPGAIAAATNGLLPVLGVTLTSGNMPGWLMAGPLSCMPPGRPVAAMGFDTAGLRNAALFAAQMLAGKGTGVNQLRMHLTRTNKPVQYSIEL